MSNTQKSLPQDYYGSAPDPALAPPANPADVADTRSIVIASYDSISGPAGQPRDWNRMRSLHLPGTRSIRTGKLPDGSMGIRFMDTETYIRQMDSWLVENGFFETEIHRVEERFGNIAHVLSTYESRHNADDPVPYMRGINSFQLLFDNHRWWIVNILWQHESPEFPLPQRYLP